ncbi:helix-turn-helix domain-containing protein [Paenibacillus sp. GCM10023252]|uniref:helix-turn-helix domain-containing protein n=1 Tax=Paenibacillus sp. GCM10023252 TaxID=3252649 RepID=UPI00360EF74C
MRSSRILTGREVYPDEQPIHVSRSEEGFYLEQHRHEFIEIIYVEEGSGFHYIEEELIRVQRGDIFYLPVGVSHVFRPSGQPPAPPLVIYNCVVQSACLIQLNKQYELNLPYCPNEDNSDATGDHPRNWYRFRDQQEELGGIFRSMARESMGRRSGYTTALAAWLLLLLVKLFRQEEEHPSVPASMAHANAMQAVLGWLELHYSEAVTAESAAAVAGMSTRHLHRQFRLHTGLSFLQYLQNRRIERSCLLLETTALSTSVIADLAGYRDRKSFYRVFRRITGVTPMAYRQSRQS